MQRLGEQLFGRRIALLGEDGHTWGPPDSVRWLEGLPVETLPWSAYTAHSISATGGQDG